MESGESSSPPKKRRFECAYETTCDIAQNMEKLVNNKNLHDISFKIGDRVVYACKFVLIIGSKYFSNILSKGETVNIMEVKNIDYDVFENTIRFITTGCVAINSSNIIELYKAGQCYKLETLVNECKSAVSLIHKDDIPNVFVEACKKILHLQEEHQNSNFLQEIVKTMIVNLGHKHMLDDIWLHVPIAVAKVLMKLSKTNNEEELFDYMVRYANTNSKDSDDSEKKYSEIMQDLKGCVKLPMVDATYLHEKIKPLHVYSDEELYEALMYKLDSKKYKSSEYKFSKR